MCKICREEKNECNSKDISLKICWSWNLWEMAAYLLSSKCVHETEKLQAVDKEFQPGA